MLADANHRILVVLVVVVIVQIAVVVVAVPSVVVVVLTKRPIIGVVLESALFNSFRLNHDDLLSPNHFDKASKWLRSGRWHSFSRACLSTDKQFWGSFISFVETFSNSLFDLKCPKLFLTEKNTRFLYPIDSTHLPILYKPKEYLCFPKFLIKK